MTVKSLFYPMENGVLWTTFISFLHIFIRPSGLYSPWNSLGQNTEVGSLSLLQGIFPTQGSNPRLPRCRQILNQLSHKGSPRILEWVAYPFSRRSSQSRNRTRVSCIAGRFFTDWAIREAHDVWQGTVKSLACIVTMRSGGRLSGGKGDWCPPSFSWGLC